jgi:hypothetical protein
MRHRSQAGCLGELIADVSRYRRLATSKEADMLALTSDKALLRAVWELVEKGTGSEVPLHDAAGFLGRSGNGSLDPSSLDIDAQLLEQLGFLRITGMNGSRRVELTQVGAFLATQLQL